MGNFNFIVSVIVMQLLTFVVAAQTSSDCLGIGAVGGGDPIRNRCPVLYRLGSVGRTVALFCAGCMVHRLVRLGGASVFRGADTIPLGLCDRAGGAAIPSTRGTVGL